MNSVFENDPLPYVMQAFRNLYPDARVDSVRIALTYDGLGYTDFNDDGTVCVTISCYMTFVGAPDILSHELAHVAVGVEQGHSKAWEKAYSSIFEESQRLYDEAMKQKGYR